MSGLTKDEINTLESILDTTFGEKHAEGVGIGPVIEEVQGIPVNAKSYRYKNGAESLQFRASLEEDSYYLNLDIKKGKNYLKFLAACEKVVPRVYQKLQQAYNS